MRVGELAPDAPASATIAARDSFGISLSTRRAIASIALSSSPLSRLFTYVRLLFIGWTFGAGGGIPSSSQTSARW
jgi:hypothetical protein